MMSPFNQIKQQLKCLFPKASKKGIDAVACILNQCCSFDPCDISTGQTVTFTSYTLIGQELCIVITVDNVAQSRCITLPSGFIQTITTYVDSTTVNKHAIGVYTNETPTPVTVYETDTKITSLLTSVGNNRIGVYNSENATLTNIYETGTYLDTFFLTGNILTLNYVGEAGTTSRTVDLTPIIPTVPVYTSSQGVSKTGTDFKLGDTAVAGTGLSATPFTSHRDITGAFRLSFKNDRILIGSDNAQDATTAKVKIVGNGATGATQPLFVTNSSGQYALVVYDSKRVIVGSHTDSPGNLPFMDFQPASNTIVYDTGAPGSVKQILTFSSANGDIQVLWQDTYASKVTKYKFNNQPVPRDNSLISSMEVYSNTSDVHDVVTNGSHAQLRLNHFSSAPQATTTTHTQRGLLIDGAYDMPNIYTGKTTFIDVVPTYGRYNTSPSGVSILRGLYYHPYLGSTPASLQYEVAYESSRGSVIINNGTGVDTLRLPSLTTTQRNLVAPLSSATLMDTVEATNVAKVVYNSTTKFVEYHNGSGWVTQVPTTLASGTVTWNGYELNKNLTLDANTTITLANLMIGSTLTLVATQDATGGRLISVSAYGFTIKTAGTLGANPNDTSVINFYVASPTLILQSIAQPYV